MNGVLILCLLAFGQFAALSVVFLLWRIGARISLAFRLRFDRGLSYTWSRAWRKAGYFLQH